MLSGLLKIEFIKLNASISVAMFDYSIPQQLGIVSGLKKRN